MLRVAEPETWPETMNKKLHGLLASSYASEANTTLQGNLPNLPGAQLLSQDTEDQ